MKQQKNFKRYFIEHVHKVNSRIKCCLIKIIDYEDDTKLEEIHLPTAYTGEELRNFIRKLDFDYQVNYCVMLGNIWFENGSYSNFSEYGPSHFWMNFKVPEIPESLDRKYLERENSINKLL